MKILQIDVACNALSTGRIAEGIGRAVLDQGGESYIAYGRYSMPSQSISIRIGNRLSIASHLLLTRMFDMHGLGSKFATVRFLQKVEQIKPDIIHLHDIHGYYLNYMILFSYLRKRNIPVVWNQHSCWAFTGHCAYFDKINCSKWVTLCHRCKLKKDYPKSWLIDRSKTNYLTKKKIFSSVENMHIISVSKWMESLVKKSFLNRYPIETIYNGIDTAAFQPKQNDIKNRYGIGNKFLVLGVAAPWTERKGFYDFVQLSRNLDKSQFAILMVGLDKKRFRELPNGIIGVKKTDSISELAEFYSAADLFFNPTWEDTFPTTNLESLACGTPVLTYDTGGSPEAVSEDTGFVIKRGDVQSALGIIKKVKGIGKQKFLEACRNRAVNLFSQEDRYKEYLALYKDLSGAKYC